jgi:two-component system, OmpR family, response regulator
MRLLVVEDDAAIRRFLVRGLTEEGFAVDQSADGEDARFKGGDPAYDLILLDLMLPKLDGLAVLREWRERGATAPVLVLTARDQVADRIRGLDGGADDYLVKPFAFDELLARIRALLRRARRTLDPVLRVGLLALDRATRRVSWGETKLDLSGREFTILEYLMQHPGEVLSRTRIYEHVWAEQMEVLSNVIDVHIKQIRRKLARTGAGGVISTVRGAGYRLEEADR